MYIVQKKDEIFCRHWLGPFDLWLWEYRVPLICLPVGLCLPSWLGAGIWQCGSPPDFSVYLVMQKLCAGGGLGGVRILPLLGGLSCQVCLQHLSKIFTLQSSHNLLPPSSYHLGTSPGNFFENKLLNLLHFSASL
jgi:hypothetical protein